MEKDGELKVPESDKLLNEIDEAKKALKTQTKAIKEEGTQSAQSAVETPSQSTEEKAAPGDSGQAVSKDVSKSAPAQADKQGEDVREWAKKKGIKDEETALRSLRELERELHRRSFEAKKDVPRTEPQAPPAWQPAPQFQPSYQPSYPPGYVDREKMMEAEARRFNMDPQDFERVLNLASEVSAIQMRKLKAETDARLSEINKETSRNAEVRELMTDPLFSNPQVQFEMHRVLEENPKAFALEPSPYLYAFNEAQRRLARQYLQGNGSAVEARSLPSNPPPESGRGTNPSIEQSKDNQILAKFADAKTAEDQKKILESLGAVQTY